ncbi:phage/plasmid primase, P4 family [Rhodococcus pyridinivorans]|uniref:DNA primase family protein n=1 Tax=Rhodococcus pyridinivorans TaxID=103816 RepID=UPI00200AD0F3|nr:phage/plasmid primase, P4 family [Rhodococcus pyridinivorans]UPW03086.1 phage/plasmid primase, P4 family [Rhodococcus pyridinivorans]
MTNPEIAELFSEDDDRGAADSVRTGIVTEPAAGVDSNRPPDEIMYEQDGLPVLLDANMAKFITEKYLREKYCWSGGFGWKQWDGRVWSDSSDVAVTEEVRRAMIAYYKEELDGVFPTGRAMALARFLQASKIGSIARHARGILEVDAGRFDQQPDLLNVSNGVVDLRTKELIPHNRQFLFTKITRVPYIPGAQHADWDAALNAVPSEVGKYLKSRFGQSITGHPTQDDVLPFLIGGGANGKSTIMVPIQRALGDFATVVADRVFLANPSDHPTELTDLHGARFALIEELPEGRHMNMTRVKKVIGTPRLSARKINKDSMQWDATHTLFITTNHKPLFEDTDYGAWRRVELVTFPFRFRMPHQPVVGPLDRHGDPNLRNRLRDGADGQHEAVLSWLIDGASEWYANKKTMGAPPREVEAATEEWRRSADVILGFFHDELVADPESHIATPDLHAVFKHWLSEKDLRSWSERTLTARFAEHEVVKSHQIIATRVRADRKRGSVLSRPSSTWMFGELKDRYTGWEGVRFRGSGENTAEF